MKIEKNFKNDLLKRTEIEAVVEAGKNPGFEAMQKEIAEKMKASEDLVVVRHIRGHFGRDKFLVEAFIYDSLEFKNATEPKPKIKKEGAAAAPAPAAKK